MLPLISRKAIAHKEQTANIKILVELVSLQVAIS